MRTILVLLLLLLGIPQAFADDDHIITIGGSVYGGGRKGAILQQKVVMKNDPSTNLSRPHLVNGLPEVVIDEGVELSGGTGTTNVTIYEGVIGTDDDVQEKGNGNVFGGGYGPAANVMHTTVSVYGGTICNSLHGGGEVAAVGIGYMKKPVDERLPILDYVERQGTTTVNLFKGEVKRNVFGGGRGYTQVTDDDTFGQERLYTDGYVFGSTSVNIYGGTIGTTAGVAAGYGNVFGGGDVGFVFSGNEPKVATEDDFLDNGKTYYVIPTDAYLTNTQKGKLKPEQCAYFFADPSDANNRGELSIACEVLIEPRCKITEDVDYVFDHAHYPSIPADDSYTFQKGDYVPTNLLNLLTKKADPSKTNIDNIIASNKDAEWDNFDLDGIIIRNAVFAGGNVSTGDDKVYAETTTVYGNVTATVNDLFCRDLITVGTEHVGGLYGDGNLTFADGYRELNLNSYGTDYYHLDSNITSDVYNSLNKREQAFYQIQYKCVQSYTDENTHTNYEANQTVGASIYDKFADTYKNTNYWVMSGFLSKFAGRLMNTIQRADFAGVFGSRLVLQGALDRVLTKEGDELKFQDYTINRIGELSLNKQVAQGEPEGSENSLGNYFGIYNQVNYLGALTSDIRFGAAGADYWTGQDGSSSSQTYYDYKSANFNQPARKNVGSSENLIALASGVALELKQEPPKDGSTPENDWGYITGVIQLELINVVAGEGGGFVYARNEHRPVSRKTLDGGGYYVRTFLSPYNNQGRAATHEEYKYIGDNQDMQTSGNFVFVDDDSSDPTGYRFIVDDCYPTYNKNDKAHFWYIRGSNYAYNQYISVYTGAAKKYEVSKGIQFATKEPGTLSLVGVYPGYYCSNENYIQPGQSIEINGVIYEYGDAISWWDYKQLVQANDANIKYFEQDDIVNGHRLNKMTHDNGFVISLDFEEPDEQNPVLGDWHPEHYETPNKEEYGPTFSPKAGKTGLYGQHQYEEGKLILAKEVELYEQMLQDHSDLSQDQAFLSTQAEVEYDENSDGNYLSGCYLCISSLQPKSGSSLLLVKGDLIDENDIPGLVEQYVSIMSGTPVDQLNTLDSDVKAALMTEARDLIESKLDRCCRVTKSGKYGGQYYSEGVKYNALDGWGLLVKVDEDNNDRLNWQYNDDALDLLNVFENDGKVISKYREDPLNHNIVLASPPQAKIAVYMSRDSRLLDLKEKKNITAHFVYSYGGRVENHYINITIDFKDELPDVGDLERPDMVLPGTKIAFKVPAVQAGAYNVTGGGWEYYTNSSDANGHMNGTPFTNRSTPFYWYQDGYYVNYYALTVVGRQYSNTPVQINVANSHDLKNVVDDPNHLMIDKEGARDAKIYINDYTDKSESGVDLLKTLFNTSLDDSELDTRVKGLANLDIILRADQAPKTKGSWDESIGSGGSQCFEGNLHGDGYTISGLDASLFNSLCGNVYNLGVTGSFTSSGIADTNSGSIENCWVLTTGSPANSTKPIANGGTIVNCYFNKKYTSTNDGKDDRFFYNGNVAYELNGFHLSNKGKESEGNLTDLTENYVENRYLDGDFRYADGYSTYTNGVIPYIPAEEDSRWNATEHKFTPQPNDYLFFGQRLTYGYRQNLVHEDKPSRISEDMVNRVYRAPAYFQNAIAEKAYYNKDAVFAAKSADGKHDVYPGMTAIDFTGNGTTSTILDHDGLTDFINADLTQNLLVYANYVADEDENTEDDDDLLTRLLDSKEPAYADHAKSAVTSGTDAEITGANSVSVVSEDKITPIKGHVVFKKSSAYQTNSDHFLVDRQDYFAPISYQMASGKRMWYQRHPDNYAEKVEKTENQNTIYQSIGWESLSLPFTAELVTTQKKGEITHFYAGETKGHEYWLRGYLGTGQANAVDAIFEANFQYPAAGSSAKTVANTFLWDYYYSKESRQDEHSDQYQHGLTQDDYHYYQKSRSYTTYPRLAANTPYIVGFPGETYYEFDLSGQFEAEHAKVTPYGIGAQTITFATTENATITQTGNTAVTGAGYSFVPCFVAKDKRELSSKVYLLNALETQNHDPAGSIFEQVSDGDYTVPFRAYFTASPSASPSRGVIFVNGDNSEMSTFLDPVERQESGAEEGLIIRPGERSIIVKSNLNEPAPVRIVNLSGITLRTFTINPGETIVTPVHLAGIYIVNHKKVAVK